MSSGSILPWQGLVRIRLARLGAWAGSTRLANCCGVSIIDRPVLRKTKKQGVDEHGVEEGDGGQAREYGVSIALADGSHHVVILNPGGTTTTTDVQLGQRREDEEEKGRPEYDLAQSVHLTETFRRIFVETEGRTTKGSSGSGLAFGNGGEGGSGVASGGGVSKEGKMENAVMRVAGVVALGRG